MNKPFETLMKPGSLPVVPSFMLSASDAPSMIYGAIRGPKAATTPFYLTFGCNVAVVPEFCGGIYITATNVQVTEHSPQYANTWQKDAFERMLSTDDLFDWSVAEPLLRALPVCEFSRYGHRSGNPRYDLAIALEKLGLLTLGHRIMATAMSWRRTQVNFWDTEDGPTRHMMKWIWRNMQGGAHYPDKLLDMRGHHHQWQTYDDTPRVLGAAYEDSPYLSRAYPVKYLTGMYLRNHNSGNKVACSTLYVSDSPRRPIDPTHLPAVVSSVSDVAPLVQSRGLGIAPVRWYAM